MSDEPTRSRNPEQTLATGREIELAQLSPADRALLTPDVLDRWEAPWLAGDIELPEILDLERRRRRMLRTIRQGAELTDLEFKLLRYLQRNERRTRTYLQIAQHLWGTQNRPITARMLQADMGYASAYVRHIWVLVAEIRRKLEIDPARPQHLALIRGVGYRWYDAPPSLNDGEDYEARTVESAGLRAQLRYDFGYALEGDAPPPGAYRGPQLGPEHPDYQDTIEADVTERRSEPDSPSRPTTGPPPRGT